MRPRSGSATTAASVKSRIGVGVSSHHTPELRARANTKLSVHPSKVSLHGAWADAKGTGDLFRRQAITRKSSDPGFCRRQLERGCPLKAEAFGLGVDFARPGAGPEGRENRSGSAECFGGRATSSVATQGLSANEERSSCVEAAPVRRLALGDIVCRSERRFEVAARQRDLRSAAGDRRGGPSLGHYAITMLEVAQLGFGFIQPAKSGKSFDALGCQIQSEWLAKADLTKVVRRSCGRRLDDRWIVPAGTDGGRHPQPRRGQRQLAVSFTAFNTSLGRGRGQIELALKSVEHRYRTHGHFGWFLVRFQIRVQRRVREGACRGPVVRPQLDFRLTREQIRDVAVGAVDAIEFEKRREPVARKGPDTSEFLNTRLREAVG